MTTTPTPASASKPSEPSKVLPRTWKPMVAGILMIIAGITAIVAEIIYSASGDLGVFAEIPLVESSASLGGGIFAILRKVWWLTIVGVIFSMFFTIWQVLVMGIISIILIATSRREFKRTKFG
jgi:membrane-bound ClpP family serine protease